jgi:hypothetical protein
MNAICIQSKSANITVEKVFKFQKCALWVIVARKTKVLRTFYLSLVICECGLHDCHDLVLKRESVSCGE